VKIENKEAQKDQPGKQFDNEVASRYPRLAISTPRPQKQPRNKRYIIVESNVLSARRTCRAGAYQGLITRQAVNNDIKKAAHTAAKRKNKDKPNPVRYRHNTSLTQKFESFYNYIENMALSAQIFLPSGLKRLNLEASHVNIAIGH
jgi:hypothetical protein